MASTDESWIPLDGLLDQAAGQMRVGELVHISNFSLFEAMSAVEVGNMKMDPGAQPQKGPAAREFNLEPQLSGAQLVQLMDHLLCLEATWHKGSSLAQTVYSSHYMMQQARCVHARAPQWTAAAGGLNRMKAGELQFILPLPEAPHFHLAIILTFVGWNAFNEATLSH